MGEQTAAGKTAVVVGIGGDIGRGVAKALLGAGFRVAASADEPAALDAAGAAFGPAFADSFEPLLGSADDPGLVDWTIGEFRPDLLILAPSADEKTAAQETFLWCREVIMSLLADSTTIVVSDHSVVRALVEDAARQPEPAARFGIRFLTQETAATAEETVAAVLAQAVR